MMIGLALSPCNPAIGRGVQYSAEATALFARMSVKPSSTRKARYEDMIVALKTASVWSKLDALYVLAAHDAQAARLNLVSASYDLTAVATPTFTVDNGYNGDGATSYLDTGFQPGVSVGSKALRDSNSMGVWSRTNLTAATADMGNTNNSVSSRSTTSGIATRNMTSGAVSTATANSLGMTSTARTAGAGYRVGRNGVKLADVTAASTAAEAANVYLLARNNAGVLTTPSTRQIAAAYAGAFLSEAEELALYNALNTYLVAVGAA